VEEHLVVSTRDRFVSTIKACNHWAASQGAGRSNSCENNISCVDYCSLSVPEREADYNSEPEFESVPVPPRKPKPKPKRKYILKPPHRVKKLVVRVCRVVGGVRMSDASPSKRRKTKGAPMKNTKSTGKQFSLAQVSLL
jgi:hypothetical protein